MTNENEDKDTNSPLQGSGVGLSEDSVLDAVRLAIALRSGRAALGLSQTEFCQQVGVSKSVLARAETAEGTLGADALTRCLKFFHNQGLKLEFIYGETVSMEVSEAAIRQVLARMMDEANARSDRKRQGARRSLQLSRAQQDRLKKQLRDQEE